MHTYLTVFEAVHGGCALVPAPSTCQADAGPSRLVTTASDPYMMTECGASEHYLLHQVVGCACDPSMSPEAEFASRARLELAVNIMTTIQASLNLTNLCKSPCTLHLSPTNKPLRQKIQDQETQQPLSKAGPFPPKLAPPELGLTKRIRLCTACASANPPRCDQSSAWEMAYLVAELSAAKE
jgi:hypothetical protein